MTAISAPNIQGRLQEHVKYEYQPIRLGEIRILVLEPGAYDSPLCGQFETIYLEYRPTYSAISYAWGDSTLAEAVILGDYQQKITPSLYSALQRFRRIEEPVRLWADALCINQNDVEERNSQVTMMADIYAYATQVLIWLGKSSDLDVPMLWLCEYWLNFSSDLDEEDQDLLLLSQDDAVSSLASLSDTNSMMRCACCSQTCLASRQGPDGNYFLLVDSIHAICSREYFRRLWPLQEMAVAKSAWVFVGQHTLQLTTLVKAIFQLENLILEDITFSRIMRHHTSCAASLLQCSKALGWTRFEQGSIKLLTVLCDTYLQQVSEPRDRVYAIRQLAGLAKTPILIPDYSIPMSTLWKRVALNMLMTPNSYSTPLLIALSGKQKPSATGSQLPSWAVDFGNLTDSAKQKVEKYVIRGWAEERATPQTAFLAYIKDFYSTIGIAGRKVSTVKEIHHICQLTVMGPDDNMATFAQEVLLPWYWTVQRYIRESQPMAYPCWAFLNQDIEKDSGHWTNIATPFIDVVRQQISVANPSLASGRIGELVQDLTEVCTEFERSRRGWTCSLDVERVLARTLDGRLAWVPLATQEGDVVCLLRSAPAPFILREVKQGSYRMIGDSFVDGVMKGEAWPDDETELETLDIV